MADTPASGRKADSAYRTISEAATAIGVPQHVLRFWETRFPQLQPLKRGGNRRYYRPADMVLLASIRSMLHDQGLTIRGAQLALSAKPARAVAATTPLPAETPTDAASGAATDAPASLLAQLHAIRDSLRAALAA